MYEGMASDPRLVMEGVGVEMLLVRDRVIAEMRKRRRPICLSCLSEAVSTESVSYTHLTLPTKA